jgi:hypothetical protein
MCSIFPPTIQAEFPWTRGILFRFRNAKKKSGFLWTKFFWDPFKPLFSDGTSCEFCFLKGKELFVGLSKEALKLKLDDVGLREGVSLLRKNIVKNFTNIYKIYIYIDGEIAFED